MTGRPSTRPFAEHRAMDPDGNLFDISVHGYDHVGIRGRPGGQEEKGHREDAGLTAWQDAGISPASPCLGIAVAMPGMAASRAPGRLLRRQDADHHRGLAARRRRRRRDARARAAISPKYIPGNPTIVARNMQGAGGIILANNLLQRRGGRRADAGHAGAQRFSAEQRGAAEEHQLRPHPVLLCRRRRQRRQRAVAAASAPASRRSRELKQAQEGDRDRRAQRALRERDRAAGAGSPTRAGRSRSSPAIRASTRC